MSWLRHTLLCDAKAVRTLNSSHTVISLTANALDNAKDEYVRLGYKDYLAKPIRPDELEDMLFYYIPSEKIRTVN